MAALFGRLGKVIEVENSSEFDALSVVTATYATYFKYLDTIHRWLIDHGVEEAKGRDYIATLFKALATAPETTPDAGFMHLARDYATRGGLNEQVLREFTTRNVFDLFAGSLDDVHRRIATLSHDGDRLQTTAEMSSSGRERPTEASPWQVRFAA
jgi:pyrroline-5-carboxylate reductase